MSDALGIGIVVCGCQGCIIVLLATGISDIKKRLDRLTELVEKLGENRIDAE